MKSMNVLIFILICLLFVSSCEKEKQAKIWITGILTNNYHPVYDLKDVFDTTYSRTTIIVGEFTKKYIRGAKVRVESENQSVIFTGVEQHGAYTYQDTGNHLIVTPGDKYRLFVEIPDGRTFESETRIPIEPNIIIPEYNDTLISGINMRVLNRTQNFIEVKSPYLYSKDPLSYVQLHIKTHFEPEQGGGFTYTIGPHDSIYAALCSNCSEYQKGQIDLITMDSNMSLFTWRISHFWFGQDSLYGDFFNRMMETMPLKTITSIKGENVYGFFGSYTRTSTTFYYRKP